MRILPVLALLSALVIAAPPVRAAEEGPADTIERGAQLVIDGLRAFFSSIPQYEAPEILPNGDIIIRRVKPDAGTPREADKTEDGKGLRL